MIKVQPAKSRLVKSEIGSEITITYPPAGFASIGGFLILLGILVLAGASIFIPWAYRKGETAHVIVSLVGLLPGLVCILAGLAEARYSWSIARSGDWVKFTRIGLWGRHVRKWDAQDVSTFWVSPYVGSEPPRFVLILGLRNGRSEDLLEMAGMEEDLRWVSAMMKERRGAQRTTPPTARAAAEAAPRKLDPSVLPQAVTLRRFPTGVELTFLPLLDFNARWWKLLAQTIAILALILGTAWAAGVLFHRPVPSWITRVAAGGWLLVVFGRFMILKQSTVIQILDGLVTVVQNQHRGHHQFLAADVEFVQTFRASGDMELQFLLRGKPKVRLLHDRSVGELEWAARFLRVALKGTPSEDAAPMKMETSAGECQVCGEKMDVRVIFCGKCRTPHHEECWSYIGQCSTYGCREIRFTRA